jgi:hypothetical protein
MRTERLIPRTAWFVSLLLGQASVLMGLMMALGWMFAFVLIVPQKAVGWAAGPQSFLPIEPPLIGMALGILGLFLAVRYRQPVARFSVAGLIVNAVPLLLAVVLLFLRVH